MLALFLLALGLAFVVTTRPDAKFSLAGWGSEATLRVRQEGDVLLFAPASRYVDPPSGARHDEVYRYERATGTITPVPMATWNAATGAIIDCDRAGLAPSEAVIQNGELRIERRPLSIIGRPRDARVSPDRKRVAVLSALGLPLPLTSPMPGLGGAAILGLRLHRLFAAVSGDRMGPSVVIGFGFADPVVCWCPDSRTIIFANPAFTELAMVFVRA